MRSHRSRNTDGLQRLMEAKEFHKETRICKKCGIPFEAIKEFPRRECNDCIKKERQAEEKDKRDKKKAEQEHLYQQMISRANIPPKWSKVTFSNSKPNINTKALAIAKEYAETFSKKSGAIAFYSSGVGTGKTHLAACIANHVLHNLRQQVIYKKARYLMLDLRATFSEAGPQNEKSVLNQILNVPLLILDDVGLDNPSQWLEGTYWTVFDHRLEWQLPMVITTNYPMESEHGEMSLGDRIGIRALSRLREMTQGRFIHTAEKDLR